MFYTSKDDQPSDRETVHRTIKHCFKTVEELRTLMNDTAAKLPEYPVVMGMKGVGLSLGPQLMAEIGDVTLYPQRLSLHLLV